MNDERPIKVTQRHGAWFWECLACPPIEAPGLTWGMGGSAADANDGAREHLARVHDVIRPEPVQEPAP